MTLAPHRFLRRLAPRAAVFALLGGWAAAQSPSSAQSFTIAVIPDTQNYIDYTQQTAAGFPVDGKAMFMEQMSYVAGRLVSQGGDIAFVTGMGDVWQHQSLQIDPDHAARGFKRAPNPIMDHMFAPTPMVREQEMPVAAQGYALLAGKTPFSVVPGNHDYDAMWTDANHPPAAHIKSEADIGMLHSGGLTNFVTVFGDQTPFFKGRSWYVASHDHGADSAQIFTAGGYRFLHIGLQFDAPNASLEWAQSVIKRYPGLPTIISTHDYLNNDGERIPNPIIDNHAVDPNDNTPQMVWDKFISQNDQIFLVLCGHERGQAFRTDDNKFGHPVYQVLADYQDRAQTAIDAGRKPGSYIGMGDGWLRLMTFDMARATPSVHVHTYSTHYKMESKDTPQYAQWYKAHEKPALSDEAFHAKDDFSFDLADFRTRFAGAVSSGG